MLLSCSLMPLTELMASIRDWDVPVGRDFVTALADATCEGYDRILGFCPGFCHWVPVLARNSNQTSTQYVP